MGGCPRGRPSPFIRRPPMRILRSRTAKSVKAKLGLMLLGVLALSGFGALAVFAAGGKADFSIAASPSSQTIAQGQSTSYSVTVTPANGFNGAVTLSVSGLPSGATASWKLSNGTSSNVIPAGLTSATLTVNTAASTPNGTTQPVITGTSDKLSHTTTVTLVVQPPAQQNFTLSASPASRTILQSDDTSYDVTVNRTGGFTGQVSLSAAGLPKGATSSWGGSSGTTLQVQTASNAQEGTYTLTITGSGTIAGNAVSRTATVTLIVQKNQGLGISGSLVGPLAPGRKLPLDLSITNPANFDVKVTNLGVTIEEGTSRPGCSGSQNFKVTQVPAARYPITVPAGQIRTLTQLGVANPDKPQVEMLDQPWNQDACKNATITLDYSGTATK